MDQDITPAIVLHWNYRGFTEFPLHRLNGEESEITDIYLKENLISRVPNEICKLRNLESLYLSGNDITELPIQISELQYLKCLDISGNRLRALPDEIGDMKCLKFLILDENELTTLPLRLNELRFLRYLSVCDNKLQWLPQRPVFNYHHCEFRFWRNTRLRSIPYTLWYHMFRDQQTRSLNIGCLNILSHQHTSKIAKFRLKLYKFSSECEVELSCLPYQNIMLNTDKFSPPSLYEITKRQLYNMVCEAAKRQTYDTDYKYQWENFHCNNRLKNLQDTFSDINIDKGENNNKDENGNSDTLSNVTHKINNKTRINSDYTPKDIIEEHFKYLPSFIRKELSNGPLSRCEYVECRRPVFDYAYFEFCLGKLILIDNVENIILSATFCSKSCSDKWKIGRDVIPWTIKC
ncbi:unnamed protein product [Diatraea saccharalis]|uniref:Disease resistance R13L4/SHOC-2-like LRR domain-containing protein n=1 Tax=Diatraea saccharalis TaxID=40085 RepID=A0A9N9QZQ9_9NEOP|nr:unnamed protein product [Diatraea saccharalis]